MKQSRWSQVALAAVCLSSLAAAQQVLLPPIIWNPLPPVIIGPPPPPVILPPPGPTPFPLPPVGPSPVLPSHWGRTGDSWWISLPPQTKYYGGFVVSEPTKITHFEVVVGPNSVQQGCVPLDRREAKAANQANYSGVRALAPTGEQTQKVDSYLRRMPDGRNWTVFQFAVDGGNPTPVDAIEVAFRRLSGWQQRCGFQVNWSEGATYTIDASGDESQPSGQRDNPTATTASTQAASAPTLKLPRIEELKAAQEVEQ